LAGRRPLDSHAFLLPLSLYQGVWNKSVNLTRHDPSEERTRGLTSLGLPSFPPPLSLSRLSYRSPLHYFKLPLSLTNVRPTLRTGPLELAAASRVTSLPPAPATPLSASSSSIDPTSTDRSPSSSTAHILSISLCLFFFPSERTCPAESP
jgi:hypothetical protein